MITKCPVCNKEFDVLYTDLWRYKNSKYYFCSWKCLRAQEMKGKKMARVRLTKEISEKAIQMAENGEDYEKYLSDCGFKNPQTTMYRIREALKDTDPERFEKVPTKNVGRKKGQKTTTEEPKPASKVKAGLSIQSVGTKLATYNAVDGDLEIVQGDYRLLLCIEECKQLMKELPEVIQILMGVKI